MRHDIEKTWKLYHGYISSDRVVAVLRMPPPHNHQFLCQSICSSIRRDHSEQQRKEFLLLDEDIIIDNDNSIFTMTSDEHHLLQFKRILTGSTQDRNNEKKDQPAAGRPGDHVGST